LITKSNEATILLTSLRRDQTRKVKPSDHRYCNPIPAISQLCLTALLAIGLQACATSSSNPDTGATPSVASDAAASGATGGASGEVVPALVGLPPEPTDAAYRIGAQDLIEIDVFGAPEFAGKRRVGDRGQIVLPLVGALQIGGLTPEEAEQVIAEALGRSYLENPQVTVFIADYASQNVTVTGAVNKSGVFHLKGPTTLLQAIALAEGLDRLANDNEVILFRSDPGATPQAYVIDLEKIHKGTLRDPLLVGNDRVVVPESGTAVLVKGLSDTLRGFVRLPIY
jgi:polysaccharide export outer membrane protein